MSKKIVSSLIIASCCFNSLPVYAGKNFSLWEQKQHRKAQAKRSNFLEKQEIDFSNQRQTNFSGPMDSKVLLAALTYLSVFGASDAASARNKKKSTCDTKQYSQEKLRGFFASSGATHAYILPIPNISMLSSGEIQGDYGSMALSLDNFQNLVESKESNFFAASLASGGACAIYQTQLGGSALFGLGDRNEERILEGFAKKTTKEKFFEFLNSRNKQHIVLPKGGTYGFVKLLPNIEGDKSQGIFKASLGHSRLDFSAYNDAKISEPHLLAFYDKGKTLFALRDQDNYIELRKESGDQLGQLGKEATHFLKSLFEGNVVRNYFPRETPPLPTLEPFLPAISLAPKANLSISYSSTAAPILPSIQRQLPEASSSDYNFKDIGIGAAAVGGVAVIGGVVWLAKKFCKKPKRSNRRQGDNRFAIQMKEMNISSPVITSNSSNSSQESDNLFVVRREQSTQRGPADGAARTATESYEPPRVFSVNTLPISDNSPRPPTYMEVNESFAQVPSVETPSSDGYGSSDSGCPKEVGNNRSTYLEMRPVASSQTSLSDAKPSSEYVNAPQVPPRPISKESHYGTLPFPRPLTVVQA